MEEKALTKQVRPLPAGTASDCLGSLGIIVAVMIAGAVLGLSGALIALEAATGDTRGGEMLFIGFAIIAGIGAGFVAGAILAYFWLRSRRQRRRGPAA